MRLSELYVSLTDNPIYELHKPSDLSDIESAVEGVYKGGARSVKKRIDRLRQDLDLITGKSIESMSGMYNLSVFIGWFQEVALLNEHEIYLSVYLNPREQLGMLVELLDLIVTNYDNNEPLRIVKFVKKESFYTLTKGPIKPLSVPEENIRLVNDLYDYLHENFQDIEDIKNLSPEDLETIYVELNHLMEMLIKLGVLPNTYPRKFKENNENSLRAKHFLVSLFNLEDINEDSILPLVEECELVVVPILDLPSASESDNDRSLDIKCLEYLEYYKSKMHLSEYKAMDLILMDNETLKKVRIIPEENQFINICYKTGHSATSISMRKLIANLYDIDIQAERERVIKRLGEHIKKNRINSFEELASSDLTEVNRFLCNAINIRFLYENLHNSKRTCNRNDLWIAIQDSIADLS